MFTIHNTKNTTKSQTRQKSKQTPLNLLNIVKFDESKPKGKYNIVDKQLAYRSIFEYFDSRIIQSGNEIELFLYDEQLLRQVKSPLKRPTKKYKKIEYKKEEEKEKRIKFTKHKLRRIINANSFEYYDIIHKRVIKPKFLTLTFKKNITSRKLALKEFNDFKKRLKHYLTLIERNKYYKKHRLQDCKSSRLRFQNYMIRNFNSKEYPIKYIGVMEKQKRGSIHFHIILFNVDYLSHIEYMTLWNSKCFTKSEKDNILKKYRNELKSLVAKGKSLKAIRKQVHKRYTKKFKEMNIYGREGFQGSVNIERIDNQKSALQYASKYLLKQIDNDKAINTDKSYLISKNLKKPFRMRFNNQSEKLLTYLEKNCEIVYTNEFALSGTNEGVKCQYIIFKFEKSERHKVKQAMIKIKDYQISLSKRKKPIYNLL